MKIYKLFNRKTIKVVFINLLIFIFILLSLETFLRVLHIPYNQTWIPSESAIGRFDQDLGWHYLPNTSRTITIGENTRNYYFDKDGIRIPNPGFTFNYNKPTVLFIGSSFTMGHGLSYEETFEYKLECLLKDSGYQFVNLGVQAYGSDQALIILKRNIKRFNTKLVIYTFNNDHLIYDSNIDRRLIFPNAKFLGTKPLYALNSDNKLYLKEHPKKYSEYTNSYLLDLIKITLGHWLGLFPPFSIKLTKALILEMDHTCKINGAQFILLNWRTKPSDYNDFNDLHVETLDTLKTPPANWENMIINGDGHPNSEATDYVTKILYEYLTNKIAAFQKINQSESRLPQSK